MPLDKKKYENTVLYLCQKLNGEIRGKKKLAKLLYFADFDFYEKYARSITGDTYRALPMGPFPSTLEDVILRMEKENILDVESVDNGGSYHPTEVYRAKLPQKMSALSEEEKQMLDRIVIKYGHLNGKQLEELSHAEAPYIGTELREEIPYELAYYRETDFSDLCLT